MGPMNALLNPATNCGIRHRRQRANDICYLMTLSFPARLGIYFRLKSSALGYARTRDMSLSSSAEQRISREAHISVHCGNSQPSVSTAKQSAMIQKNLSRNVAFSGSRAKQFNRLALPTKMTVEICDVIDRPSLAFFVSD